MKFSALVVMVPVAASMGLTWMATRHERAALEAEVRRHGSARAANLAGVAQILFMEARENLDEPLEIWEGRLTNTIASSPCRVSGFVQTGGHQEQGAPGLRDFARTD